MATPMTEADVDSLTRDISARIVEELPSVIRRLLTEQDLSSGPLQFQCSLLSGHSGASRRQHTVRVASVDITDVATPTASTPSGFQSPVVATDTHTDSPGLCDNTTNGRTFRPRTTDLSPSGDEREPKRRATGGLRVGRSDSTGADASESQGAVARRLDSDARVFPQRKKRLPENPILQPSSLDKFIFGVWESLYSAVKLDPEEIVEQFHAIEPGQPRMLLRNDEESELATRNDTVVQSMFGRMNVLARKISQTSRTCRSLEVIVQAQWVQAFDDRVAELATTMTKEKAKKTAISEACIDFGWTEKELRNKVAIWRGYHDIKNAGGWAALVFAGMGLYRFCKYRVSFTEDTFQTLRSLRHRFEVSADCLHPRWRSLLAIVGAPVERRYEGHPHGWVVCGPGDEAIPLPITYRQWDPNFTYTHLDESVIDEDAWGLYDPRTVSPLTEPSAYQCQICNERQSDDPRDNNCTCFPNLYGSAKAKHMPVQVYRTPNGKNNGLLACCPFERGAAIGEFVGQITSGVAGKDVMIGQTDRATYQIWQGEQGNYTRFVNHSCAPNSQFERFVWLGTQRIVLVSKGVDAGAEITVDYSDTYWKDLNKRCLCESMNCRYRARTAQVTNA
ncbi:SET domain-containing protein [Cercospora beticola]|uniref:SET domain-containing protein n=2 Tax=Cercospora beticola TaxID=122368 RepID=A0A2G5IB93_CERBT|nr:SET domain-containing protein [Cercospora beticola]PIB02117.1 SET domain-containing protein [Cercospora beticola]CAK1355292.1 unnamed protein product [Cercospora beticola]